MTPTISFGDKVRVRFQPETVNLGLAGLSGSVYGMTTPSKTGIDVIGTLQSDYAVNVHLDDLGRTYWLAPELLDLLDHAPGAEITVGGNNLVRQADGGWQKKSTPRPWWKFWANSN